MTRNEGATAVISISALKDFWDTAQKRAEAAGMSRSAYIVDCCYKQWEKEAVRAKRPGRPRKKTVKK